MKYCMILYHEKTQKEHNEIVMRPVTKQNAITINECAYDMRDCGFPLPCFKLPLLVCYCASVGSCCRHFGTFCQSHVQGTGKLYCRRWDQRLSRNVGKQLPISSRLYLASVMIKILYYPTDAQIYNSSIQLELL